ncbi:MAG: CoA activase, partial [Myxococcales bacterium]|nr:CoA activase [Myxococcales bacterium]
QKERNSIRKAYPNLVEFESKLLFKRFYIPDEMPKNGELVDDIAVNRTLLGNVVRSASRRPFVRSSAEAQKRRQSIRVGIPKALNIWNTAPFWRTYFESLGIQMKNVVFSDDTTEEMWIEGGKYGSIDPCYPSKVAQAHIHNLLYHKHEKAPLNYVFFPCITHVPSALTGVLDVSCCTIVSGTPEVMKASFTKEIDFFAQRGITYLSPSVTFSEPNLLKKQLFEVFAELLEVTEDESDFACDQAWKAMTLFKETMQEKGKAILEELEADDQVGLLMVGRPYHLDPGLNHSVMDEFQVLGYPILSMSSIPTDPAWLERYFKDDLETGRIRGVLDINEVWPENFSANSAMKVWAARFAAHHPNLALLDLSSFKCGHDAPTYGIIDGIVNASGTPYSALHDIDANKPTGSIAIRVKTFAHSLKLHRESLEDVSLKRTELRFTVTKKKVALLQLKQEQIRRRTGQADFDIESEIEAARVELLALRDQLVAKRVHAMPTPEPTAQAEAAQVYDLGKRQQQAGEESGNGLLQLKRRAN